MEKNNLNHFISQDSPITMGQVKEEFEKILDGARKVDAGEWPPYCFIGYVRSLSENVVEAIEYCYGDAKNDRSST